MEILHHKHPVCRFTPFLKKPYLTAQFTQYALYSILVLKMALSSHESSQHNFENESEVVSSSQTYSQITPQDPASDIIYVDENEVEDFEYDNPRKRKHPIKQIESSQDPLSPLRHKTTSSQEVDSQCCSVCYEPWTTTGIHRLVSLKCGHLFGESCIDKWLRQTANSSDRKCPQCKRIASFKDIRPIYATNLTAVDNSELESVIKQVESEKVKFIRARKSEANMALKYQLSKAECERLKVQILELEMKLQNQGCVDSDSNDCLETVTYKKDCNLEMSVSKIKEMSIAASGGCRILEINPTLGMLLVSRPSTSLYRGYGLVKISTRDLKEYQFVPVHSNVIRDVKFCPNKEDILLTVSIDKTAKLTSISSNSNVSNYVLPRQPWACCWDSDDANYFYTALNNGSIEQFDIRQTNSCVSSLSVGVMKPITCISSVPASGLGGILVATVGGCYFLEKNDVNHFTPSLLQELTGNCTSVTYDSENAKFLASFRPTLTMPMTRHAVCEISRSDPSVSQNEDSSHLLTQLHQFTGGPSQTTLSRSHLFTPFSKPSHLSVAFGDESTKSLIICDTTNSKKLTHFTNKPVIDVKSYLNFIAAITEEKLFIYELK